MIFRSKRLIARAFEDGDLEAFVTMRADPEVARFQSWENYTEAQGRECIDNLKKLKPGEPGWFQFAIVDGETREFIGDCGLNVKEKDKRLAEIGYTLTRNNWNKGLGSELVRALTDYAFASFEIHRLSAPVDPRNLASCRVVEKAGFRKEGHFRQSEWHKGEWADDAIYGLLREEWEGTRRV